MNITKFAEAQRGEYVVYPELKKRKLKERSIPFIKLLDNEETSTNVERRWELYHQLYSHFHFQVDSIIANIERDLKTEISEILFSKNDTNDQPCFNTLFLLGSDSTTNIEEPKKSSKAFGMLVELTPKESPNVRMMLKRSMFKLFTAADADQHNIVIKTEGIDDDDDDDDDNNNNYDDDIAEEQNGSLNSDIENQEQDDVSYDLTLVENFKKIFGKDLHLVFNFKDVDSINFQTLDSFIVLLKGALNHKHLNISLVFNINTNLSNIEKNLKQSTIRLLKRNFHKLDVSSNKGFKYGNRIFQSFLDTVDGKLNLSDRFVQFILDKMGNNTNHNLQLLTKILDHALMTYFFENPFSVFIDPVNVEVLDDNYLKMLTKCPTFMFFIEGLLQQNAPLEDIMDLLINKDKTLEEFFVDFLVRENPINGHAKYVANYLEQNLKITNYNLIELYKNLLTGKLEIYLQHWPGCKDHLNVLKFEPIDTIFQELFTLDNNNCLLAQAMFPHYKSNIEDSLLSWERILPSLGEKSTNTKKTLEVHIGPILGHLFKLYREANSLINMYDFYVAFKESIPQHLLLEYSKEISEGDKLLTTFLTENIENVATDKITLVLFMQAIFDLEHMGFLRAPNNKNSDIVEKCIWRGI